LVVRLGTAPEVLGAGRVLLDGTDAYYHLRRAFLVLESGQAWPQHDHLMSVPQGGAILWPPGLTWLLAGLAWPWRAQPELALEVVGALVPVVLGLLQILLVMQIVRRLAGEGAAVGAGWIAALLPATMRYTVLGALDHDPLVELAALVAVLGLATATVPEAAAEDTTPSLGSAQAGDWRRLRPSGPGLPVGAVTMLAAGLSLAVLSWAGSTLHLGLVGLLAAIAWLGLAPTPRLRLAETLALGAGLAALVISPFAAVSHWSRGVSSYEGLSWLHVVFLLGLVLLGALGSWPGRPPGAGRLWLGATAGIAVVALAWLLPRTAEAVVAGLGFLGGASPFLAVVAESRPLLSLWGELDLRPALVRLSALPMVVLVGLLVDRFRGRRWSLAVLLAGAWWSCGLALALLQSRYSHLAGLATAVFVAVGLAHLAPSVAGLGRQRKRLALIIGLVACSPTVAAYLPLPGFGGLRVFGRTPDLVSTGVLELATRLRQNVPVASAWHDFERPSDRAVLAPWSFGHWLQWFSRQGTVANPFGPHGQPVFEEAEAWWLGDDPATAEVWLRDHRIQFVLVETAVPDLAAARQLAGLDPVGAALDPAVADRWVRTMGARLAFAGTAGLELGNEALPPLGFLREVDRSSAVWAHPAGGWIPRLRLYEVLPAGERSGGPPANAGQASPPAEARHSPEPARPVGSERAR
jgi:asparagine N-glycosylation enzyme membrane subunit Stt3